MFPRMVTLAFLSVIPISVINSGLPVLLGGSRVLRFVVVVLVVVLLLFKLFCGDGLYDLTVKCRNHKERC